MSAEQQIALALRKERIVVLVSQQREQLALLGERLRKPCAVADKIIGAGLYAKAHPWTLGVAAGAAVLIGRHHLFRVAGYAWSAWRTWRFVGSWTRQTGLAAALINIFKNK
jgi:hypothetical protein